VAHHEAVATAGESAVGDEGGGGDEALAKSLP